jgi:post-segregation antitoxin (ccd killing protein)
MTINHRAEALSLLAASREDKNTTFEGHNPEADRLIAEAQVHATLARDEEQAARTADMRDALRLLRGREYDVRKLVSTHIAKALASREPNRWKAGRALAIALDKADCNMDESIDARLSDDGWDPRSAWKAPASAVRSDDPWAATPDITADIPEPVVRVIAGHLAEMLLGNQSEDVHQWARGVAFELKRVGADITPAIEKRITELTLGRDPSDPPF